MPNRVELGGMDTREAVEEIAHQIRSHQLQILSTLQLLRRLEAGDLNSDTLETPLDLEHGFDVIQQSIHRISELMTVLVDYVRDDENL